MDSGYPLHGTHHAITSIKMLTISRNVTPRVSRDTTQVCYNGWKTTVVKRTNEWGENNVIDM